MYIGLAKVTAYQSAATNTGYQSAATNTGYQSVATNTGDQTADIAKLKVMVLLTKVMAIVRFLAQK